jgi:hypothetical protein
MKKEKPDSRIERLYYKHCSGVQVDIMDIGKIFKAGRDAMTENPAIDDAALAQRIVSFVQTIRKN